MTLGNSVFLLNSLIWSMALGMYLIDVAPAIRRAHGIDRARLVVTAVVIGFVVYGFIEAYIGLTHLAPRHFIGLGVGSAVLIVSALSTTHREP